MANRKTYKTVIPERLRLRKKPNNTADVILELNKNDKIEVISPKSNGWYGVKFKDFTGYVMAEFVE